MVLLLLTETTQYQGKACNLIPGQLSVWCPLLNGIRNSGSPLIVFVKSWVSLADVRFSDLYCRPKLLLTLVLPLYELLCRGY